MLIVVSAESRVRSVWNQCLLRGKNKRKERHKNFRIYLFSASLGTKWCPGRAGAWLEETEDNSGAMQGESGELQEEHWGGTSSLILSCIYFLNLLVCSLSLDPVLWYLCRFIVNISPQGGIEEISLDCTRKKKKRQKQKPKAKLVQSYSHWYTLTAPETDNHKTLDII